MSYIGFMRNTVNHIEKLFNKYLQNTKIYPSSLEKEDYKKLYFPDGAYSQIWRNGRRERIQRAHETFEKTRFNSSCRA